MTKLIINGSKGRMGQTLLACAAKRSDDFQIVGQVDLGDNIEAVIGQADVVVDFSNHKATPALVEVCAKHQKALVIGTTGHTDDEKLSIACGADPLANNAIPIVKATNFSTGVNVFFWLTSKAVELLDPDYDLEVVEMHHRLKKDAPSGTAETLFQILSGVRDRQFTEKAYSRQRGNAYKRPGRQGDTGVRDSSEIGMHALRGGDVVGDHTVIFAGDGERLELTHKASSREAFANGALLAAEWIVKQPPGLYSMQDVLGLASR